jgi:hypothetical protein
LIRGTPGPIYSASLDFERCYLTRPAKLLIAIAAVIITGLLIAYLALRAFEPKLRAELIDAIEHKFDAKAEIQSLEISVFPVVRLTGKNLTLWYKGRRDIPPLIHIDEFFAHSQIRGLFQDTKQISEVNLKGLIIQIPPKEAPPAQPENPKVQTQPKYPTPKVVKVDEPKIPSFVVARINSDGSVLKILPSKPGKDPLIFEMHKLTMTAVGPNKPFQYESTLKNPRPPGLIYAKGEFGPWNTEDPGGTPASGVYTFRDADLSIFKGISGKLSSNGKFRGVLERIDVNGTTDIPDFQVRTSNHKVHLQTEFKAVVDGTSGDVLLDPVVAKFGKTSMVCRGAVVKKQGLKGKSIVLDVRMENGRIEDVVKLAVAGEPPMVGKIQFTSKMDLPPGDVDVIQKLRLDGSFGVGNAEFTTPTVQEKIETLSIKSRGIKDDEITDERIVSDLKGSFVLRNAIVTFRRLSFRVPGAAVQLEGTYNLASSNIDFDGTLQMQAKLSETQKGIKSLLLKVVDPFFRKGKTTVLPIKVTGSRKDPKFGLRLGGDDDDD